MVMSMSSLLRENSSPDIEDVHRCLAGNLCRCTGYGTILDACESFCRNVKSKPVVAINTGEALLDFCKKSLPQYSEKNDPEVPSGLVLIPEKSVRMTDPETGQKWYKPATLKQLEQLRKTLPDFEFVAGGTGSYNRAKNSRADAALIQISDIAELKAVSKSSDGSIVLGSGITLSQLSGCLRPFTAENTIAKTIMELVLPTLASRQVRNVATIGGSLMWGHPCSDLNPVFIATRYIYIYTI